MSALTVITMATVASADSWRPRPSPTPPAGVSYVQGTYGDANRGTTAQLTPPRRVAQSDLLAVYVLWSNTGDVKVGA